MVSLGDRMKNYELETKLVKDLPVVLRLDGHGFSKFTKCNCFTKPFDEKLHNVMIAMSKDLMHRFDAAPQN